VFQQALADPFAISLAKTPEVVTEGVLLKELPNSESPTVNTYLPLNDGTATEEDTMNHVLSVYSSLMPKGDNLAIVRLDNADPPVPDSPAQIKQLSYKPTNPNFVEHAQSLVPEKIDIPDQSQLLSSSTMEKISLENFDLIRSNPYSQGLSTQQKAMAWSQYLSSSINSPPAQPILDLSKDAPEDTTGHQEVNEPTLAARKDEGVVEGWKVQDVKMDVAQVILKANQGLSVPSDLVDHTAVTSESSSAPVDVSVPRSTDNSTPLLTASTEIVTVPVIVNEKKEIPAVTIEQLKDTAVLPTPPSQSDTPVALPVGGVAAGAVADVVNDAIDYIKATDED
jgi:hypothetical protein